MRKPRFPQEEVADHGFGTTSDQPLSPISPGTASKEDTWFLPRASIAVPLELTPSSTSLTPTYGESPDSVAIPQPSLYNNRPHDVKTTQDIRLSRISDGSYSPPRDENGNLYCEHPNCTSRSVRFARRCEWEKHRDTHTRPYVCRVPGCEKIKGFTYSGGLLRHQREVHQQHGGPINRYFCPFTYCKRSESQPFLRKENLTEHLRRVHRNQDINQEKVSIQQENHITEQYRLGELLTTSKRALSHDSFSDSGYASNLSVVGMMDHFLTSEVVKTLQPLCNNESLPRDVLSFLPKLLNKFASKLGHQAQGSVEYDVMDFISNHQNEIISTLQDQWQSNRRATQRGQGDEMSLDERVRHWQETPSSEIPPSQEASQRASQEYSQLSGWSLRPSSAHLQYSQGYIQHSPKHSQHLGSYLRYSQDHPPLDQLEIPNTTNFRELTVVCKIKADTTQDDHNLDRIKTSPAYIWFIQKLSNLLRLTYTETMVVASIEQTVYDCFPKPQNLSRRAHILSQMIFNIEWPLMQFLQEYQFDGADDIAGILKNFVAITSDGENVQAMTVLQYCRLVWGQTGEQVLNLIIGLAQDGEAELVAVEFAVTAQIHPKTVCFEVAGLSDSFTEIGEQLAWMGAVFRASPVAGDIFDCITSITSIKKVQCETIRALLSLPGVEIYSCDIIYHVVASRAVPEAGNCWHGLFRYGIIAHGFPIAKRANSIRGLEMNLDTMLALSHARHIGRFDDKIIIKGFSSMFSLSEHQPGVSVWHFSGDLDGPYMSFSSVFAGKQYSNLGMYDILHDRHFVGWCLDVSYGAGALDSNYCVQPSDVRLTHPGCLLYGKTMRRGQTYPVADVCIADSKDTPRRTATQSLQERLKRIHARPVVLWDDDDKRGWLTNGTSALLHLTLASVENSGSPFDMYCLRKEEIRQHEKHTINAAAHILLDERNWKLPIQWDDGRPVCFRDRMEDLYFLLEIAIDHQITSLSNRRMLPGILEGWDFMDMASMAIDPLNPRAFPLTKDCCGWMTFLEDTKAVTLFGKNFGDIFQPRSTTCTYWNTLPKYNCYLAANTCDLETFAKAYHGSSKGSLRKLTAHTIWPNLSEMSRTCGCSESNSQHIDLVQVLVPEDLFAKAGNSGTMSPTSQKGAVIFGEVKDRQWFRSGYCSSPQSNPLKRARCETDSETYDSGLGDSVSSVTAVDATDCPTFSEYLVAIICALPEELLAVRQLFDQKYTNVDFDQHDENSYAFGRMSCHNVVAACLPGIYGTCSATHLITGLKRSFPNVEFCLLVGIGGGIPSKKNDIRLGDVIVSCPKGNRSGTIKHDFLRITQGSEPELLGCQREPPARLLSAISLVRSNPDHLGGFELLRDYIDNIAKEHPEYSFPGADLDILYESDHRSDATANSCSTYCEHIIQRSNRTSTHPYIHYGLIASGDQIIKDSKTRDRIAQQYDALCFEMEAAGVVNVLPSLIIRGISDYADSHKNDIWHKYAAATAAAYAKFLLDKVRPKNFIGTPSK